MKVHPHEIDLIYREGYMYRTETPRGWYYKGKWVGDNVKDVFAHREKREKGEC